MSDDDVIDVVLHDLFDPVVDGAVQTEPFAPDHLCAMVLGPFGHFVVVAGDERGELTDSSDHPAGHPSCETCPVFVADGADQASLCRAEPLHRNENGDMHSETL